MQKKDYKDFFENFKKFKEIQNKQKQRGLNDFNIFSTLRKKNAEVGLHSNFIYSLLNPNSKHCQNELFLELFIKDVLNIQNFGNIISVKREDATDEQRRIDFTIESDNYLIGIEMKSSHSRGDEKFQLSHYKSELEKNATASQEAIIYYLTLDGKSATDKSLLYENSKPKSKMDENDYKRISFKKHIFQWIEHSYDEVKNITNLAVLLTQYKEIVQQISRKDYKGNVMELYDYTQTLDATEEKMMYAFMQESQNLLAKYSGKKLYKKVEALFFKDTTISYVDINQDIVFDEEACINWFKSNKNHKNFGFEFKKNGETYIFELATQWIYFGTGKRYNHDNRKGKKSSNIFKTLNEIEKTI